MSLLHPHRPVTASAGAPRDRGSAPTSETRRTDATQPPRQNFVSPFAADSARKGTPQAGVFERSRSANRSKNRSRSQRPRASNHGLSRTRACAIRSPTVET